MVYYINISSYFLSLDGIIFHFSFVEKKSG